MREKILEYLKRVPGARKWMIASEIGCWQCDADFLHLIHSMEKEGLIYAVVHNDPAQMEYYDEWYVKT